MTCCLLPCYNPPKSLPSRTPEEYLGNFRFKGLKLLYISQNLSYVPDRIYFAQNALGFSNFDIPVYYIANAVKNVTTCWNMVLPWSPSSASGSCVACSRCRSASDTSSVTSGTCTSFSVCISGTKSSGSY